MALISPKPPTVNFSMKEPSWMEVQEDVPVEFIHYVQVVGSPRRRTLRTSVTSEPSHW